MTTRFREERNAGHTAKEAAQIAVEQCSQSILTSGLTFFAATFSVSLVSRMELIGVLCKLISRGALISMSRGEIPVGCCQWPSGYGTFHITHAEAHIIL